MRSTAELTALTLVVNSFLHACGGAPDFVGGASDRSRDLSGSLLRRPLGFKRLVSGDLSLEFLCLPGNLVRPEH